MQVARNRSYSTTNAPKLSTDHTVQSKTLVTDPSPVLRRKKSTPVSTKSEHK